MIRANSVSISDFDYPLPDDRIARFPVAERDASRLLVWRGGDLSETRFRNIGEELPPQSLLVFNNTKVIRARIVMHKPSGARIEIFCLEPHAPADYEHAFAAQGECRWLCIVGNLKKWKEGALAIEFDYGGKPCRMQAWHEGTSGTSQVIRFAWDAALSFGQLLEHLGRIPIPPYLGRESEAIDDTRYQTVYSRFEGSVAAPTAGLHFTPELIGTLRGSGIRTEEVTLHVGAGTFLPVKADDPLQHTMHTEHFEVTTGTVRRLTEAMAGRHVVAVGTTSVRTLESLAVLGWRILRDGTPHADTPVGQWEAYDIPAAATGAQLLDALASYMESAGAERLRAATQIMIMPGFTYRVTSGLITNFHQPKSTLLLLVSAFIGEEWRRLYDHALSHGFRFLSYGDSSLLLP
jgi:S-adenosylmethionine:tRNA ribosyltransferase-isomerase